MSEELKFSVYHTQEYTVGCGTGIFLRHMYTHSSPLSVFQYKQTIRREDTGFVQ